MNVVIDDSVPVISLARALSEIGCRMVAQTDGTLRVEYLGVQHARPLRDPPRSFLSRLLCR